MTYFFINEAPMDEFDNLDDLELNIEEKAENNSAKRLVQVFGWITFGLGIIYLIVSFIRYIMMSFIDAFSGIANNLSNQQSEAFDFLEKFIAYQKLLTIVAIVISVLFIIGGIGYALRREWGRKIYLVVCILGIGYHLFSGYVTFFILSDMNGPLQGSSNDLGPFSQGVSSITWFFTSLIPMAYLIINVIIAGRVSTKEIMK